MIFITFVLLSLYLFDSSENKLLTEDLSNEFERIRVARHVPGLSGLAMKNGKIMGETAVGYRRHDHPSRILINDLVNIGSCTKWMTATLAGRLIDRKLLSWSTTVSDCFPNSNSFNVAFQNATLEQLLAHRTGIQQTSTFYNRHGSQFVSQQGTVSQIRRWVAETVLTDEPEIQPGEFLYSNPGYTVAVVMMEQVTCQDWETLISEHVFIPLNMTSSKIGPVYNDDLPPNAPNGHDLLNETIVVLRPSLPSHILHVEHASTGPAGFIACTLADFAKFLYVHLINDTIGYLTAETAAKLKSPYKGTEGYGLGVIVYDRLWAKPGQALMHNGDAFGQNTIFWMAPAKNLIAIAYTNCRSDDGSTMLTLDNVIGVLLEKFINF